VHNFLLSLHLIAAVFFIGPVAAAGPAIARATRAGDVGAVESSARMMRIYGYGSLLVALFGLGLVQKKWHAEFGDTWVWLSLVLFMVALGVIVGVALPALEQLVAALRGGSADSSDRVKAALGKVMGASSVASVAYVVIIVLMVTKPGS
jgi:uncharacterized membrane protein